MAAGTGGMLATAKVLYIHKKARYRAGNCVFFWWEVLHRLSGLVKRIALSY